MRRDDDRHASLAEPSQQAHHAGCRRRIEARCRLVQEEQAGPGQKLDSDAGPLALATRQRTDGHLGAVTQIEVAHGVLDDAVRFRRRSPCGQP
jgi:hypothetical protein